MAGMPILQPGQIEQIRAVCANPTLDVLYNSRTETYVLVQKLPGVRRRHPFLVGCVACPNPMTPYKCLFELKSEEGYRLEPSPLLIKSLVDRFAVRADSQEFARLDPMEQAAMQQEEADRDRSFEEIMEDDVNREIRRDQVVMADRKHFRVSG